MIQLTINQPGTYRLETNMENLEINGARIRVTHSIERPIRMKHPVHSKVKPSPAKPRRKNFHFPHRWFE